MIAADTIMLHVRLDGRSFDVPLADLDVGPESKDRDIKNRLAGYLGMENARLGDHAVDRHPNGNLTIRPHAVFG